MRSRFIFIVRNGSNQESKETVSTSAQAGKIGMTSVSAPELVESLSKSAADSQQERKIWTRREFTHQNSGIGKSDDDDDDEKHRYRQILLLIFLFFF